MTATGSPVGVGSARLLPLALVAGLVFGAADRLARDLPGLIVPSTEMSAPWLALAFALGAAARSRPMAAVTGAVGLLAAVAGYYGAMGWQGAAGSAYLAQKLPAWVPAAVLAGLVLGVLGRVWRSSAGRVRAVAAALPCGLLAGEALVGFAVLPASLVTRSVYPVELLVAALLPLALARGWRPRLLCYAVAVGVGVLAVLANSVLRYGIWGL